MKTTIKNNDIVIYKSKGIDRILKQWQDIIYTEYLDKQQKTRQDNFNKGIYKGYGNGLLPYKRGITQ